MSNRTAGTTRRRSSRPVPPRPGTSSTAPAGGSRGRVLWIAIAAVVVVAAVIGIAVAATGGGDGGDDVATETGGVETIGDALPLLTDPGNDPAVGMEAPFVSAATFDGERVTIDGENGARVYGFFAHWCPVCQRELPTVVDHIETTGLPDDVEFWAVSTGVDSSQGNYPPSEWFEREGYDLPVLLDSADSRLASAYGLGSYPYFVVVNDANEVVFRISGELTSAQFGELFGIAQNA